jgi:hypothetical protein
MAGFKGEPVVTVRDVLPTPLRGLKLTPGGAEAILKVTVAVDVDVPSVPVIVIWAEDGAVGVPEITPVLVSILKPAGSVPLLTAYVTVPANPFGMKGVDAAIAVPSVPFKV